MARVQPIHPRRKRVRVLPLLVAFVLLIVAVHVFVDELYQVRLHQALGYGGIYTKNLLLQLVSRYGGALFYAWLFWRAIHPLKSAMAGLPYKTLLVVVVFVGWTIGFGVFAISPTDWYLFFHHQSFRYTDPLFHLDVSFYTFDLPILQGVLARIVATVVFWIVGRTLSVAGTLWMQQRITSHLTPQTIYASVRRLLLWLAVLFFLFACVAVLNRYAIALWPGTESFLHGPDYVTAHLTAPVESWLRILSWLLVTTSVVWMAFRADKVFPMRDGFVVLTWRPFRWPLFSFGLWVLVSIGFSVMGQLMNSLYVKPNQNTAELPYIQNTVNATRYALGINQVDTKSFMPTEVLTASGAKRDQNALSNVRINDQNQTTAIYNQLQSFKSYFQFDPASVDRYNQQEVYVSTREMNVHQLPVPTWINQTLVYTHGYGLAASPVNSFDAQGLPVLWAQNTPQQTQAPLPAITQPRIYFGLRGDPVIAPSKQAEFDYPSGSGDATSHYQGGYGLPVSGNRLLMTLEQGTLRYYTTDQLVPKSEYLFDRNIYQRVADIAPFLTYDHDAFPFITDAGHIDWMMDAYTSTNNFPYAQTFINGTPYIRNSVKVVVDAYTGQVTFYVVDSADPIVQSLEQIYPNVFTSTVPTDVRSHFRYPLDLFQAQSTALTRYHMTDASAFYNQEDQWAIANQIYQQNNVEPRPPVYQMIRMPDQTTPQFVLSSLFTPVSKDNLNGWLIADNQPDDYGHLSLYQFPQSKLIFGPMQAENQIDANPSLSSQLSLWNQQGSQVIRGDLLLIPVKNALLYVEPIYLVANRQNSLPQLERVVIDFNEQVFVDTSLEGALNQLLNQSGQSSNRGGSTSSASGGGTPSGGSGNGAGSANGTGPGAQTGGAGTSASTKSLVQRASQLFNTYETETANGNFAAAGKALQALGAILQQLNGQ